MRSRSMLLAGAACALAAAAAGSAQIPPRPATFEDVLALRVVGGVAIAPAGGFVLYTVRQWEPALREGRPDPSGRRESRTQVWRVSTTGEPNPRRITFGDASAGAPAWSPDGRFISFVTARGKSDGDDGPRPQIWIMPADGGEGWPLTAAQEGVGAYAWSPDGRHIAYVSRDPLPEDRDRQRRRRDDAEVFEGDFRHAHLWTIDVETKTAAQVTSGTRFTVGGPPSWSPDGTRLAFAATPTPMTRDDRSDVYIVTLATGEVRVITTNLGSDSSPAWSPDGSTIAYVAEPHDAPAKPDGIPAAYVGNAHLMLYDVRTGQVADAASPEFDLSPGAPQWSRQGGRLYLSVGRRVYRELYAFDVPTGRYTPITRGRMVSSVSFSDDARRAAFIMDSATAPAEVFVSDLSFDSPRQLTTANLQVADLQLAETEVLTWSSENQEVEGLLVRPWGVERGKRSPLLVVVHGGPTGAHTNGFKLEAHVWAAAGWAVLYPNPRGSTNYGQAFMRANIPDWGGGDYRDIMSGVDAAIDRGVADPSKLAVMGWSYGGYMTCWIVSQTSRFKAAMMGAGLANLVSMYGTTDIPDYLATFFQGPPSVDTEALYRERSGLTFVDRVTTPLLILHGGRDERVPIGQPMEFYRALRDRGRTVELVFYPREGHGLGEYYHQLDRLTRQHAWITKYTLGDMPGKTLQ